MSQIILLIIFRIGWVMFFKPVFLIKNCNLYLHNSILSHIAKKLQAQQFSQKYLSEEAPDSKFFFFIFFDILKTVLVVDLIF